MKRWRLGLPCVLALLVALLLNLPALPAGARTKRPECRPQRAKEFLKRSSFVRHGRLDAKRNERALRWRIQHYGRVDGVPFASEAEQDAHAQGTTAYFFGIPLRLHRAIAPALDCVERRIVAHCRKRRDQYRPRALGGFRDVNTYRGGEVSNHLFGIAIDIDPDRNPCCGCVEPWPEHPACRDKERTPFEQTSLPSCWIHAFERYGFYWLGRDPQLRDTMHFEFLGDPERILVR